jgi:hypothetical protein
LDRQSYHENQRRRKLEEVKEVYNNKSTKDLRFRPDLSKPGVKKERNTSSASRSQARSFAEFLRDQERFKNGIERKIASAQKEKAKVEELAVEKRDLVSANSRKILAAAGRSGKKAQQ